MLTVALSHLLGRGVRLETHEAVALARELLAHPCGIPTPDNIQIGSDGSASCTSTEGVPSAASVARLLLTLLPEGTPNVPAPLRYAIARGLQAVAAPPFASLAEFSRTLERFEKGASRDVLRGVLQRGASAARSRAQLAAVPTPVTPPAGRRSPVAPRPTVVPLRPVVLIRRPATSSGEAPPPFAAAAPIFSAFSADGETGPPLRVSPRRALAAASALVASFAVGFALADGITGRRAVTTPSGTPAVLAAAAAANHPAPKPPEVQLRDEIVRVPETPAETRETVPAPAAAGADARAGATRASLAHAGDQVKTVEAVRATPANAFSPAFAADGTAIFFHTGRERDARSAIEVASTGNQIGADLAVMTVVDDGAHNYHAQPSPDGRFVAFDSDRDGERGVYVANRDGSQVRRVSGPGYAAVPTWSRNNEWLAYIRAEANNPAVWNLWVQPAAGGSARRLTNYRYGQTWAASWFPDDRRIAYSHEDTLLVMDVRTGRTTRYPTPVKGHLVRTPAVSPDGTKIIFQVLGQGVWLLHLDDGSMQHVLTDPTAEEFAWSPDSRRVAFHSRRDDQWRIYVMWGD